MNVQSKALYISILLHQLIKIYAYQLELAHCSCEPCVPFPATDSVYMMPEKPIHNINLQRLKSCLKRPRFTSQILSKGALVYYSTFPLSTGKITFFYAFLMEL